MSFLVAVGWYVEFDKKAGAEIDLRALVIAGEKFHLFKKIQVVSARASIALPAVSGVGYSWGWIPHNATNAAKAVKASPDQGHDYSDSHGGVRHDCELDVSAFGTELKSAELEGPAPKFHVHADGDTTVKTMCWVRAVIRCTGSLAPSDINQPS